MRSVALVALISTLAFMASCMNTSVAPGSASPVVEQDISFSLKNELPTDLSFSVASLMHSWQRQSPLVVYPGKSPVQESAQLFEPTIQAIDMQHSVVGIIIEEVDSNGEEVAMIRFTVAESNAMRDGHDVLLLLTETGIEIEHDGSSRNINWIIPPADWKSAIVPQTSS